MINILKKYKTRFNFEAH